MSGTVMTEQVGEIRQVINKSPAHIPSCTCVISQGTGLILGARRGPTLCTRAGHRVAEQTSRPEGRAQFGLGWVRGSHGRKDDGMAVLSHLFCLRSLW